jgi:hypothetical protein
MVHWPAGMTRLARWPRIRYSIRGLLVFMFGLAVALTTARSGQSNWSELLLAAFSGWFMVGMAETAWDTVQSWQAAPTGLPRDVRFGMLLEMLWPLGVITMVIAATGMDQFSRRLMASESSDLNTHVAIPGLVQATLMLAVICGYWRESSRTTPDCKWDRWNAVFVAFVVCAGLFWISLVVLNQMLLAPLIHVAIEGVRSALPTRWGGQDFEPVRLLSGLYSEYVDQGLIVGALSAASFGLACSIPRAKRTHWAIRIAMSIAWCGCIAVIAIQLHWSYTVALPDLSPFLASRILTQPATNYAFGLALIHFASSWLA